MQAKVMMMVKMNTPCHDIYKFNHDR